MMAASGKNASRLPGGTGAAGRGAGGADTSACPGLYFHAGIARRIWSRHPYHVTNVREDGTLPQFEPPSWKQLNTFRTNSQIESGGLCKPPIPR